VGNRFAGRGRKLLLVCHLRVFGTARLLRLAWRHRANCSGLVPLRAICTEFLAKKPPAQAFDIHNPLNGNLPEEENQAAQFKLKRRKWNASIQQPS